MSRSSVCKMLLVLLSILLVSRQGDSQEPRSAENSKRWSGIVRSVDRNKNVIEVRVKSDRSQHGESVYTLHLDSTTKLSRKDGNPANLSDLKEGSVVEWTGRGGAAANAGGGTWVTAIMVQEACTPDSCARSKCNRTCRSN